MRRPNWREREPQRWPAVYRRFTSVDVRQPYFFMRHAPPDYSQDLSSDVLEGFLHSDGMSTLYASIQSLQDQIRASGIASWNLIMSPRRRCRLTAVHVAFALKKLQLDISQDGRISDWRFPEDHLDFDTRFDELKAFEAYNDGVHRFVDNLIRLKGPSIIVTHEEVMWQLPELLHLEGSGLDDESPRYAEVWHILPGKYQGESRFR